ncbi:MAG: carboxypeptidase M32, partial [Candidatus Thermoplasmatota archaeon]|nr:carboxypeptidase M32 [Candidatus Thermoplasmatota archaeon]
MPDYDAVIARVKELSTIESIGGLLAWDQETMMPSKGGALRAESLAFLSGLAHSRLVDPAMGELLEKLENADIDEGQAANVREVRHAYDKATKLPAELVEEIARHKSQSLQVWQEARAEDNFSKFQPALEKMVDLQCQAAE